MTKVVKADILNITKLQRKFCDRTINFAVLLLCLIEISSIFIAQFPAVNTVSYILRI